MDIKNVAQFFKMFPDEDTCLEHLMLARFGKEFECPKCERKAKFYRIQAERAYSCEFCGHHVHPTVGTPFEKSRTPLQLWFYAIYLFTTTRHGVSAKELQRQLGVTYKCAWRMGHEIRKHMARVDGDAPLSGVVEIDETMIGGYRKGIRGRGAKGKTVLFGMMQKDGDVMTKVVPNVRRATLQPIITDNVTKGSHVHTDELYTYKSLTVAGYTHTTVTHNTGEYVNGDTHVNSIEGYWARLKASIQGTHHVSVKHLHSYAGEFEYRYNSRKHADQMFPELIATFPSSTEE